jgi:hypothetical protein
VKFCSNCGKKIERNVDITTKIVKCSNCGRVVDSQIKGEIIDSKIREEWNVLLEKYLIKLSERRIRDFEEKINFYKLKYLKKNILGMGHEEKIVNEISDINSILWIKAIMNKPIELKNITRINDVLDYSKFDNKDSFKNLKQMTTLGLQQTSTRYQIFMNVINKLKTELVKIKLNENKLLSYSTFIQWTYCKNNKKYLDFNLIKITRLLNYHSYKIIFAKSNKIVAEHKETKNNIYLNLSNNTKSNNWDISLHILGKIIMGFKKPKIDNLTQNNEIVEEVGALTKYDWHAADNKKRRCNALKKRLYAEGFKKTIGTLQHCRIYWRSPNSQNHKYLPAIDDDILWLQTYPMQDQNSKKRLFSEYAELQKNNEQLKSKKPSLMFFVNMSE